VRKLAPTILVAGLLVATATAFAVTEHLKLQDSPVISTRITKLFSPKQQGEARIAFRLRREADLSIDVVGADGTIVRHGVGSGIFNAAYHQFAWDGRNDAGQVVPDGIYRAELTLKDVGRTIEFPNQMRVDSTAPTISVTLKHRVFSPDGDGRADRVDVRYRFSEPAWAILYVDGKRVGQSGRRKAAGTYPWYARGKRPGEYRLALAARDRAGNMTPSTREFTVRLRFVQLFRRTYRPGGRTIKVRVSADTKTVHWRLGALSGTGKPPVLKVAVPAAKGRYVLVVSANGHSARANVVVGARRR
jgi:hypothetical protein